MGRLVLGSNPSNYTKTGGRSEGPDTLPVVPGPGETGVDRAKLVFLLDEQAVDDIEPDTDGPKRD